jgi:D-alanyl-D-alanine carboxypeptidase
VTVSIRKWLRFAALFGGPFTGCTASPARETRRASLDTASRAREARHASPDTTKALPLAGRPLTPWLDSVRIAHDVPALVAIVVRSDSIVDRAAVGVRRMSTKTPVTLQDRFQIGSNTKAMTASVIASLVEGGKLAWTTTPVDVFPELRDSIAPAFRAITIEQLLSHRAGVSPFTNTNDSDCKSIPKLGGDDFERRRRFVTWLLASGPAAPPGTKYMYSNAGYTVAAVMAERAASASWETLMRERVFRPLGISASFSWGSSVDAEQPWGHSRSFGGVRELDPRDASAKVPSIIWPAGAVEISIEEYGKFLQAQLRGLRGRDTPMLRAESVRQLHSPRGPTETAGGSYALGWGRQLFEGDSISSHAGSAGYFYAVAMIVPSRDLAVAVIANAGTENAALATRDAIKALVRRYRTTP